MSPLPVLDALSGWRLAPDGPFAAASWPQAVPSLTLLDEITGEPPDPPPAATTTTIGLTARVSTDGGAGLVGCPLSRFPPGFIAGEPFSITGVPLQLSLSGVGFLPLDLTAAIGPEPGYPPNFTPVQLGSVALHREPVTISGRTVSRTGVVRAGTSVTVDGIWLTLADVLAGPPAAANLITILSPLYANRDTTGTVAQQNLPSAPPAEAKTLTQPGNVGDTTIGVSDQVALAIGTIVVVDGQDPQRAEYLPITAITSLGPGATFPAVLGLAFPLSRPHAAGAPVIRIVPPVAGAANPLSRATSTGDATLFPASMAGLDASMTGVVISGGGGVAEYHAASLIVASTDASGFFALPPIHRVAQLRLRAHHLAEPTDLLRDVMVPFGIGALNLNLVFP